MYWALGQTKQAGFRLDQKGGIEWHQEKAWEPAEIDWCSIHHCDDAYGPADPGALLCPGMGHSVPAGSATSSGAGMWLWALPLPSVPVLGWAGSSVHTRSAVVAVVEHPGMGWDWKCGRCCRVEPSLGACHPPVVPGLAAPSQSVWRLRAWREGVAWLPVISACSHSLSVPCISGCAAEQTWRWFGNYKVENYNHKANFRPQCATLCMHVLGDGV